MRKVDVSKTPALCVLFACAFAISCLFGTSKGSADGPVPTPSLVTESSGPRSTSPDRGEQDQKKLDPAAWGGNHIGKAIPDFVHGDDCLFCHRNDIGPGWQKNSHGITVRQREDAPALVALLKGQPALASFAPDIGYFMGSRHHVRFLKKEGYGKFAILSTQAEIGKDGKADDWKNLQAPKWDTEKFADQCAGCHATAVEVKTKAFSAFGLDCYTCHGNVNLEHTNDTSLIFLSKKSKKDPKAIESACASCHLRGGRSKSTGLPYPNNFIAGDNLFQDYEVDFSRADDPNLNPGDRHVLRNVRDVVVYGNDFPTCANCHQVHTSSSDKHRRMPQSPICFDCHNANDDYKTVKQYTVHSSLCEY